MHQQRSTLPRRKEADVLASQRLGSALRDAFELYSKERGASWGVPQRSNVGQEDMHSILVSMEYASGMCAAPYLLIYVGMRACAMHR